MNRTKIEWASAVWNPVTGCTKISPGCANCYAERMSKRLAGRCGYPEKEPFKLTLHPDRLQEPLNWKKPKRIFVCSMSDLFHDDVPDDFILEVFNTMANAQWINGHRFMVLTKRPERMKKILEMIKADIEEQKKPIKQDNGMTRYKLTFAFPLQNIWLGVSVENQEQADKRIPLLLQTPAAVRFLSCEPLLGPVNLQQIRDADALLFPLSGEFICDGINEPRPIKHGGINWIIAGGESGPGARPMHTDWVRSLRDQCQAAGVPYFFKQWGEFKEIRRYNSWPKYADTVGRVSRAIGSVKSGRTALLNADGSDLVNGGPEHKVYPISHLERVGIKNAGRLLDGREWSEFPEVKP